MSEELSSVAQDMRQRTEAWARDLKAGGRTADQATRAVLEGRLGRWIEGRLTRHFGLAEDAAEEVLVDVILKFARTDPAEMTSPFGLLCRVVNSAAIDRIRRQQARTPDGGFVDIDDDNDDERGAPGELAGDWHTLDAVTQRQLQDCVRRMLQEFASAKPGYARLLAMCLDECDNDEIASAVFELPVAEVTDAHRHRIKNRLLQARKESLPYMRRCHG
jgi:DNA-directed RNA polymerase specialized sigma24 family protein